jgi:hypothetical protein
MSPSTLRKFKDTELNILHTAVHNQVSSDYFNRQYERLNVKEIRNNVKPLAELKVELLKRDIPSTDKDKEQVMKYADNFVYRLRYGCLTNDTIEFILNMSYENLKKKALESYKEDMLRQAKFKISRILRDLPFDVEITLKA